jgi:hypothetical protein
MPRIVPMPPALVCGHCRNLMRAAVIETEQADYSLTYSCGQCGATRVKKFTLPPDEPAKLFKMRH